VEKVEDELEIYLLKVNFSLSISLYMNYMIPKLQM
jgi:hypothetical protein